MIFRDINAETAQVCLMISAQACFGYLHFFFSLRIHIRPRKCANKSVSVGRSQKWEDNGIVHLSV